MSISGGPGQMYYVGDTTATIGTYSGIPVTSTVSDFKEKKMFGTHAPKDETFTAVKLTEKNLKDVAAYVVKRSAGPVEVDDTGLVIGETTYLPGVWLVEEYGYVSGHHHYREAKLDEREKYDLR